MTSFDYKGRISLAEYTKKQGEQRRSSISEIHLDGRNTSIEKLARGYAGSV
jgi:hypothetical protein